MRDNDNLTLKVEALARLNILKTQYSINNLRKGVSNIFTLTV